MYHATHLYPVTGNQWHDQDGRFSEGDLTYDLNGNIMTLKRQGTEVGYMDNLDYHYSGNRLLYVGDGGDLVKGFANGNTGTDDYAYDVNGNMSQDKNKGIGPGNIRYNFLNLPQSVRKSGADSLVYIYDATGRKLRQQVYGATPKTTDYAGDFFYENDTLRFINHEEGRVVPDGSGWEHQYHLKDHLGNVRMTFTSKVEVEEETATLETANVDDEVANFLRYENASRVYSIHFDQTNNPPPVPPSPDNTPGFAQRLNGSENEKYGLARSLSVMPGDTVRAEVYGKYVDSDTVNWTGAFSTLIGQVLAGTGGVVFEGASYAGSTSGFLYAGLQDTGGSTGGPKAYLNWLIFDRDFNFIDGGYSRMSSAPKEYGQGVDHERMFSPDIVIDKPGYVYIYLSNEELTPVEVYFDDMKVEHVKGKVVQMDDFYPFGLTFNSYSRENSFANQYQYNAKELQDELDLGWLDYGARMYMPDLGRWTTIDPLAEQSRKWSPYAYGYDNPVLFVDPDGMQNIVYLYANKDDDGGGPTRKEMRQMKRGFNQWAKANSLDTRAKVINHVPNASRLDKSDHFIAVGTAQSNKELNSQSSATGYDHLSEGSLDGRAATADMTDPSNKGNISYMNIESLREGFATKEKEAVDNFAGTTFAQYVGGVALHETGHSSSLTHSTPGYFGGDPTKVDESRGSYDAHDTRRFNFMSTERQWETGHTFNSNMSTIQPVQRKIFTDKFNGTPIARIRRRK
jgi:RHS repeat-associated protein